MKGTVATRVVVGEARRRAVLGGHQRHQQHVAAAHQAAHAHPRNNALHFLGLADVDADDLVQRLLGFEHHQGGHQLGHRGDGHHQVGVVGVDQLAGGEVHQHGAAGGELQLSGVTDRGGRLGFEGGGDGQVVQKNRALSRAVRIFTGGYRMKSGMKIACANWRTL